MLTIAEGADGALIRIAELASVRKRPRPLCRCVACKTQLTPKLGSQQRHHFAHRPGAVCVAAGGEGELHLEAKLHLCLLLRALAADEGVVDEPCTCPACRTTWRKSLLALRRDDLIEVERSFDRFRADVAVHRDGKVVGVFEVVVTHPCSDEKWEAFREQGVIAFEVAADQILGMNAVESWADRPASLRSFGEPVALCLRCALEAEAERLRPKSEVLVDFELDVRHRDGRRQVAMFTVCRYWDKGVCLRAEVHASGSLDVTLPAALACDKERLIAEARRRCREWKYQFAPADITWTDLLKPPRHDDATYGWLAGRWVRCYEWEDLQRVLGIKRIQTLVNWYEQGKLKAIRVAYSRNDRNNERLYDAESIDRFAAWLAKTRAPVRSIDETLRRAR